MKYFKFTCILLLSTLLTGCMFNNPKYINFSKKPNEYYYSNEVYKKLNNNENFSLQVFDVDFYEYYDVSPEDNDILLSFFKSLNNDNYVSELDLENDKVRYKLIIEFDNSKYIINIYNKDTITLFPWDGNFQEDIIIMHDVPLHNNIYSFCAYIINKAHSNN